MNTIKEFQFIPYEAWGLLDQPLHDYLSHKIVKSLSQRLIFILITKIFTRREECGKTKMCYPDFPYFFLFLFFKIFIFTLFYFTILYWFCHTLTWIHHGCTWVPNPEPPSHLPSHIISLDHPRASVLGFYKILSIVLCAIL